MRVPLAALALACLIASPAWADYKPYPGAKLDQPATDKSRAVSGTKNSTIFTTTDSWDKVLAFYKALGTEYKMPGRTGYEVQLPSGGPKSKQAIFIFDGAPSIASSKNWLSIADPFIGNATPTADGLHYEDIRAGTIGIVHVEAKP
jgi:hypothetical protein